MFLPMMGFFFMLIVFGGLAGLATIIDINSAHRVPFPFAFFFAGVAGILVVIVGGFVDAYINHRAGGFTIILVAPTVGLLGGGILVTGWD